MCENLRVWTQIQTWPVFHGASFVYQKLFKNNDPFMCNKENVTEGRQGKVTKGNYSVISQDRVMVLVHCTSSHCVWQLYEVVLNSNQ